VNRYLFAGIIFLALFQSAYVFFRSFISLENPQARTLAILLIALNLFAAFFTYKLI